MSTRTATEGSTLAISSTTSSEEKKLEPAKDTESSVTQAEYYSFEICFLISTSREELSPRIVDGSGKVSDIKGMSENISVFVA